MIVMMPANLKCVLIAVSVLIGSVVLIWSIAFGVVLWKARFSDDDLFREEEDRSEWLRR